MIITGETSDHNVDILAKKNNLSYLIDIKSLHEISVLQRMHIAKTVYKAVDVKRDHNEKLGVVYTGPRPFPETEKVADKYADFSVHVDDLQSFLDNPRYNLHP